MKKVTLTFYSNESTKRINDALESIAQNEKLQGLVENDSDIDWTIK